MTTLNRDALLKVASLVRPALSTQMFIPALTHIRFADGHATAFNDVSAITVKSGVDVDRCVPGELLIKALSSFNSESVSLQDLDDGVLLLSAGRSKLKVPTLPVDKFPLSALKGKPEVVPVTNDILEAVRRCLFSVGTDPTHPTQMGVTMQVEDGCAVLYSTDNFTISRAATKTKLSLPGDSPVVLPTFFCDQMIALAKAFPDDDVDLEIYPAALQVTFGKKARLLTKTMADLEPLDFQRILGKYLKLEKVEADLAPLPTTFDAAWNRALLVLSAEADKATRVDGAKGKIVMESRSDMGEATDELEFEGKEPRSQFHVDPTLVVRAAKTCGSLAFYDRVMVLATDDASFVHLIAHCAA